MKDLGLYSIYLCYSTKNNEKNLITKKKNNEKKLITVVNYLILRRNMDAPKDFGEHSGLIHGSYCVAIGCNNNNNNDNKN